MAEAILARGPGWFTPTDTSITRQIITEIEIKDSYSPDSSISIRDSWDASVDKDGSVTCYIIDKKLIIAGNGTGKVYINEMGDNVFGHWDTSKIFSSVISFKTNGVLDASKCLVLDNAFSGMKAITELDLSCLGVSSKLIRLLGTFADCRMLENLNISGWDVSNSSSMETAFSYCEKLRMVDVSKWNLTNCKKFSYMFRDCKELANLDTSNWKISNATDMSYMFRNCSSLKEIDAVNWNLSNVINFSDMFLYCSKLTNLNTSNWNISSATNMSFMFYGCSSLKEIDVSNWDVSKVTNFDHFAAHANLKRKGIENWKTTSATNMNALFHNCAEEELDLSGWDVSKNQFFCQMFENSPNLKRIKGLEKWNTSSGLGFDGMFERCSKLEELDLSSFNTTKAKNDVSASVNGHKTATMNNMFLSCDNLKKVTVGPNFSINGDGSNTTAANKVIFPTPSASYIEGADGNWYTFTGDVFAPNAIKDKTAETYYASRTDVFDADVIVKNGSLIDIAKAIREKNGATTKYTPSELGAAIRALS